MAGFNKQDIINYTSDILEKVAQVRAVVSDDEKNKESIIQAFYDLDDGIEQLERVLVECYDITTEDVQLFEEANFLVDTTENETEVDAIDE